MKIKAAPQDVESASLCTQMYSVQLLATLEADGIGRYASYLQGEDPRKRTNAVPTSDRGCWLDNGQRNLRQRLTAADYPRFCNISASFFSQTNINAHATAAKICMYGHPDGLTQSTKSVMFKTSHATSMIRKKHPQLKKVVTGRMVVLILHDLTALSRSRICCS